MPELWVMEIDGSNMKMVTEIDRWSGKPSWSPDGSRIAFEAYSDIKSEELEDCNSLFGCQDVYILDLRTGEITNLTKEPSRQYLPAWSPDGARIAFIRTITSRVEDLWVVDIDGKDARQLTTNGHIYNKPSWSPDGTRIAYVINTPNVSNKLWVVDVDASNSVDISHDHRWINWPAWSPDGEKIAFGAWSEEDRDSNIWLVDSDGTSPIQLTHVPADYTYISWVVGDARSAVEHSSWGYVKRNHRPTD